VLKLIIEDDEGRKTVVPFVREEITIGRQEGNTIRLTERNVSRRHARLMRQNGHVVVEDLGSSNGTRINGERISGQSSVKDGDLIQIGDYDLALQSEAAAGASARSRPAPADDEPSDAGAHSETETETETPIEDDAASSQLSAEQRRHSTAIIKMDQVEGNRNRKVKELEAEEAPRLVVVSAELKGQEYACIRTEMKIGRTDDNDIVIDHRSLSRTHAKIVREDNGEWRILDMQSANGMTVNGDTYAQAPLNNGDVVELGHVKLRFVGAGEAVGAISSGGRSKLPVVLALAVVLLGAGGAAVYLLKSGPSEPTPEQPQPPPHVTQQTPTEPPPTNPHPPEPNPSTEPPNPGTTVDAAKVLQERIQSAQKDFEEGNLDKAEDELKAAQNPDGSWPKEARLLANQLADERKASKAVTDAQSALEQKKYDDAVKLVAPAKGSKLFGAQHDTLLAAIEEARKAPPKPETGKPQPPPAKPPTETAQGEAKSYYEDGIRLHKGRQFDQAILMGEKCLEVKADFAECHMLLGAAYASIGKMEMAAKHYREFLKQAPDHKFAPKIRLNLEAYEKGSSTPANP
jgi:pSer/pThr/pTyr-binding forkhead associated (FHA) protein/Tfp pilus assembly protein PilF